jgi:hypothetical protein
VFTRRTQGEWQLPKCKPFKGVPGIKLFLANDAAGKQWKALPISGPEVAVEDLKLADLNGDGRLDIIAAGRQTKNLRIFFKER